MSNLCDKLVNDISERLDQIESVAGAPWKSELSLDTLTEEVGYFPTPIENVGALLFLLLSLATIPEQPARLWWNAFDTLNNLLLFEDIPETKDIVTEWNNELKAHWRQLSRHFTYTDYQLIHGWVVLFEKQALSQSRHARLLNAICKRIESGKRG